ANAQVGLASIQGGGTLAVDQGATLIGDVVVTTGTLRGPGTITGNVTMNSNSTLAPTNANSTFGQGIPAANTMTVNGNVAFNQTSIFQVHANADGSSDKLAVGGTATLAGAVQVLASGAFAPLTTYTILTATGGVTGSFGSVSTDFAFLMPTLAQDSNNVFLTL